MVRARSLVFGNIGLVFRLCSKLLSKLNKSSAREKEKLKSYGFYFNVYVTAIWNFSNKGTEKPQN